LLALGLGLSAGGIATIFYHQAPLAGVLVVLAAAMPFTTVGDVLAAGYRGLGQLWVKVVCVDLARAFWVVVALVYLIGLGANTLFAIATGFGIGALLSAILIVGLFWHSAYWRLPALRKPAGELLRYSLPLFAAGLLSGPIVNIGLPLLLGSLGSVQAVSYFNLSLSLQLFVYLPISSVEQAAVPVWSGQIGRGAGSTLHASYAFFTRWSYVVASVVFALLFFNAPAVLSFVYGREYAVATSAMQALSAVTLFGVAVGPTDGMLRAIGDTRWILISRLVAGVASLGVAFLLIPQLGLMGAVIAFMVSSVLTNGLYTAGLFWLHDIHPLDGPYIKTLLASFIGFLFIGFAQPYLAGGFAGIEMITALYATLMVVLLHALRAFTVEDVRAVGVVFQQIRGLLSKRGGPDAVR
jgi:O-antigen/teichoic acid export membrane protein